MLSLSVPRLTALASTSTFPSHRRHFLQRKPLSVSVSTTTAKPSLHVASVKPSHLCRRFQLAAGADSRGTEEEGGGGGGGGGGLEVTIGGLQVEGEEFMVPEEEEEYEEEEYEEEEYEEEEDEGEHDEEEYDEEKEGEEGEGNEEEDDEDDFVSIRPPIVLKFIWMEKNIGLSLEMVLHGKGTIPLTPYYFWPRKDAWEELKAVLEEKKWVSQKRMIILLNQATDIINLWQQSGVNVPTSPV